MTRPGEWALAPGGAPATAGAPPARTVTNRPGPLVRDLLGAGVLTAEDVVGRGVEVRDRSTAMAIQIVRVYGGQGLLVKQALDSAGLDRLAGEIQVYRLAGEAPQLAAHLPDCRLADPDRGLLVLDFVEDAETLYEHAGRSAPDSALRALGEALGHCHQALGGTGVPGPLSEPPWVLRVIDDPTAGAGLAPEARSVLSGLSHRGAIAAALRRARAAWRAEALIHGDLKFDNCLVRSDAGESPVLLVDWELAATGDPAWDIGSVIQECMLLASPAGGDGESPGLECFGAGIGGFLGAYARSSGRMLDDELRRRVVLCTGARLLQAALEYASRDGRTPIVDRLANLGTRVLTEPGPLAAALGGSGAAVLPADRSGR